MGKRPRPGTNLRKHFSAHTVAQSRPCLNDPGRGALWPVRGPARTSDPGGVPSLRQRNDRERADPCPGRNASATATVGFGFWDVVESREARSPGNVNRAVEREVARVGGLKSLYSDASIATRVSA